MGKLDEWPYIYLTLPMLLEVKIFLSDCHETCEDLNLRTHANDQHACDSSGPCIPLA